MQRTQLKGDTCHQAGLYILSFRGKITDSERLQQHAPCRGTKPGAAGHAPGNMKQRVRKVEQIQLGSK